MNTEREDMMISRLTSRESQLSRDNKELRELLRSARIYLPSVSEEPTFILRVEKALSKEDR